MRIVVVQKWKDGALANSKGVIGGGLEESSARRFTMCFRWNAIDVIHYG